MAVDRLYLSFDETTVTGTGQIKLSSVEGVEEGKVLFLGPSTNTSYLELMKKSL